MTRPKETRIVLRDPLVTQAERLKLTTKARSLSEVVGILIARYGKHLESTWEIQEDTKLN
ncbi:MAG: hypothetical protein WA919_03465 [Coleofasciculaceae cyanobacterium]